MYSIYRVEMSTDSVAALGLRCRGQKNSVLFRVGVSPRTFWEYRPVDPIRIRDLKDLEPIPVRPRTVDYRMSTAAFDDDGNGWAILWERCGGKRARQIVPLEAARSSSSGTSAAP